MRTHNPGAKPDKRRFSRRVLCLVLGLALAVTAGYLLENYRGTRALEQTKRDWAAKGLSLAWKDYMPQPVPDEQNVLAAPIVKDFFSQQDITNDWRSQMLRREGLAAMVQQRRGTNPLVIAELEFRSRSNSVPVPAEAIALDWQAWSTNYALTATNALRLAVNRALGLVFPSAANLGEIAQRMSAPSEPARIYFVADPVPSLEQMQKAVYLDVRLKIIPASKARTFKVIADNFYLAEDFVAWAERYREPLAALHTALQRPQAYLAWDYQSVSPTNIIPYFYVANSRTLAQSYHDLANACLLAGRGEEAARYAGDVLQLRRCTDSSLEGRMLGVGLTGLYAAIITHGFQAGAWSEANAIEVQEQMQGINLLGNLRKGLASETARYVAWHDQSTRTQLIQEYQDWFEMLKSRMGYQVPARQQNLILVYLGLCPAGWPRQNARLGAEASGLILSQINVAGQRLNLTALKNACDEAAGLTAQFSPYTVLTAFNYQLPYSHDYLRACVTAARIQTYLNEAMIACALLRYHKANGAYPQALAALVPQYLAQLPQDIMTGQPLRYRPTPDGSYWLYSVGEDGKDDGGPAGHFDPRRGDAKDWVWLGSLPE